MDSTPLLNSPDALRERARTEGYLFFRGLVPRDEIEQVRHDLLQVMAAKGWLAPQQDAHGGRLDLNAVSASPASEMRLDIGVTREIYDLAQRLESVHRLPHHPALKALYETLFGAEVLVHPRHIIRMVTAHPEMVPTPHHQDFPLIQGTGQTWTAWIPLGDCARDLGGLAVLRGSHRQGYLPVKNVAGAGGIAAQLCRGESDWRTTGYHAGDVLTFPAYTVHRGLPCARKDEVRLSLDVRYQDIAEPIENKSLLPHCELSWDEIYAGWQSDDLKYYWQHPPLQIVDWDDSLMQPSRRIC